MWLPGCGLAKIGPDTAELERLRRGHRPPLHSSGDRALKIWKFPDQVIRLGILLILVIAATVAIRARFVPESFGEIGHYRAAAIDTVRSLEIRYAGGRQCVECHDIQAEARSASYHRGLSCEVCHGASAAHAEDYESQLPVVERDSRTACLHCHEYLPSRPTGFPQIIERLHNPLQPCIGCHDPHDPTPPEIPGSCAACHAQIARTKSVSHHVALSCETCHETSPEHRESPRSFPSRKPTAREFCGQCHASPDRSRAGVPQIDLASHGERYLCWQCHYPHFPEG
jgi:ribosomal protein S27AE